MNTTGEPVLPGDLWTGWPLYWDQWVDNQFFWRIYQSPFWNQSYSDTNVFHPLSNHQTMVKIRDSRLKFYEGSSRTRSGITCLSVIKVQQVITRGRVDTPPRDDHTETNGTTYEVECDTTPDRWLTTDIQVNPYNYKGTKTCYRSVFGLTGAGSSRWSGPPALGHRSPVRTGYVGRNENNDNESGERMYDITYHISSSPYEYLKLTLGFNFSIQSRGKPKLEDIMTRPTKVVRNMFSLQINSNTFGFVYYESLKRELKTKTRYEYRCDERLIKLT